MDHVFGTYRIQKIVIARNKYKHVQEKDRCLRNCFAPILTFQCIKYSFHTTPLHQDIRLETPELLPEKEKPHLNQSRLSWWWFQGESLEGRANESGPLLKT